MRKSLPNNTTFLCLIASLIFFTTTYRGKPTVSAAENQQSDQLAKDSSIALRSWMAELIDAIKTKDGPREKHLIESLVMPIDASWFAEHFDKNTADLMRSAYADSMKDFEATASRLYEADVKRGSINIHVNRYADPNTAPSPFDRLLQSMTTRAPLYEIAVRGERPSFEVQVSATGGPSKVVAGDLDGYFIDTAKGFRYVPSGVLTIAAQERAKQGYEILSLDADGRPAVVRMKSVALAIVERTYPTYPQSARAKHISGEVRLSARIGKDGRVKEVNVESGPPELRKAAVDCVKKWRFKPVQIGGSPVEVESEIPIIFSLAS
jgi:TonB family protein